MAFKEHMVKREIDVKNVLFTVVAYLAAVIGGIILFPLLVKFGGIALLVFVGLIYLAYHFTSKLKKEFEYICTDDNIDIDLIMNMSKRKRLLSFNISQTEIIAPIDDIQYKRMAEGIFDKKIDATSKRKDAQVYFAIVEKDGKTLLTFEPTRDMLEMLQKYSRSKIHI